MSLDTILQLAAGTISSPMILFFVLGFLAAFARVDLSLPQPIAKTIAVYLMVAIGFKGGVGISENNAGLETVAPLAVGVLFSAALPFLAYGLLRATSRLGATDAAAVAAHYGSISIVTFLTASQILTDRGQDTEGILVAIAAAMEAPAIVAGLWLAGRAATGRTASGEPGQPAQSISVREAFLNSSVIVLLGALVIGWFTGREGMTDIAPFVIDPFKGVLCLFLLDIGAIAGRGLSQNRRSMSPSTVLFGLYMPMLGAMIMAATIWPLDMSPAGKALMMVLGASASYIAVPAAMRLALPQANPVIYSTLSLGITFPFNILIGIPIYIVAAEVLFA